jgi:hypothetical protein
MKGKIAHEAEKITWGGYPGDIGENSDHPK